MKIHRNIYFLFLGIILVFFILSCGKNTTTTSTPTPTESELKIIPPLQMNMFITPDIKSQAKTISIWSDIDWRLSYNADWLDVSPTSGSSFSKTEVTVKINNAELKPGEYETDIVVESETDSSQALLPVKLVVMTEISGQVINIPTEIQLNDISPDATGFSNPRVKVGALKEAAFNPYAGGEYVAGDPCIIVTGEFKNNTDNDTYMLITVEGYDAAGIQRSWSLSSGPRVGTENYDIPANSSIKVELLLSWANNLSTIKIIATVISSMFPEET